MSFLTQGAPYAVAGAGSGWLFDDDNYDFVPVSAPNVAADLVRGIGHGLSGRAFANDLLPVGLAMIQKASGAETASYTSRVAINGTFTNCNNLGGVAAASQVAGTFPAGCLSLVGRTLRIRASGTLGATSTPNLTIDLGLGASDILATTGVLAMATATTPAPWFMDVQATVTTAGASAVFVSEGFFLYSTTSSVVVLPWTMGNSTRGTGLSVDLTAAQALTLNATCGTSNSANRIICNTLTVEVLY